jgi:hypothetical protein
MRKVGALSVASLVTFLVLNPLPARPAAHSTKEDSRVMKGYEQGQGKLNPKAPRELSHFAFLIGKFRCEASLKQADGTWQSFKGSWDGDFILDGYAIADEYRMTVPSGEIIVLGMNFRSYDAQRKSWNIKWLNALTGTWIDLGTADLGGVHIDDKGITYSMKEPVAAGALTRATYMNISGNHFTWRGERSDDSKAWAEFMRIECYRTEN